MCLFGLTPHIQSKHLQVAWPDVLQDEQQSKAVPEERGLKIYQ